VRIAKAGGISSEDEALLKEGSRVEADFQGHSGWFAGAVAKINSDGTFDIRYDDGEFEQGVSRLLMRMLSP
jgi:hypothetical protein